MTTTTAIDAKSTGLASLAFARKITDGLLDGIPEDKATHQPFSGANHVLWNVGHLAWADDYFLTSLAGRPSGIPEAWQALFGMGSEPVDEPGKYPSLTEVRAAFDERRQTMTEWFQGMDDAKLAERLPDELKGFAENYATMIGTMAAHECMHNGQISCVRKAMGLERKFG